MDQSVKPWWQSKSIWLNLLAGFVMMLSQFSQFQAVAEFLKVHFAEAGLGWALVNMALRVISKDKISIS